MYFEQSIKKQLLCHSNMYSHSPSFSINYIHTTNPYNINFMNNIHKEKNNLKEVNTKKVGWEKKSREKTKENIHDPKKRKCKIICQCVFLTKCIQKSHLTRTSLWHVQLCNSPTHELKNIIVKRCQINCKVDKNQSLCNAFMKRSTTWSVMET